MAYRIKQTRKSLTIQVTFILFIFIFAIYNFIQSDFFILEKIDVKGNKNISKSDILNVVNIKIGSNIFHLNLRQTSQNLNLLPAIKNVTILRKLPDTVIINVEERKYFAVIPYKNCFKIIDNEFIIIKNANKISSIDVPLITGINMPDNIQNGEMIDIKNKDIILEIVKLIWGEANTYFSEINLTEDYSIKMYTNEGIEVHFGDVTNIRDKFLLFKNLYLEKAKQNNLDNIIYIDVSFKGRPVIKYE